MTFTFGCCVFASWPYFVFASWPYFFVVVVYSTGNFEGCERSERENFEGCEGSERENFEGCERHERKFRGFQARRSANF